jgi:hypothetical protein
VFHGYRFGTRRFGLTAMTLDAHLSPDFRTYPLLTNGGILARDGSGDEMVQKMEAEYFDLEAESKGYSRWFWMSFHASLEQCKEATCGGAPQLAGLHGQNGGKMLGVYFRGAAFVGGLPCVRSDIEYRDELFQRVDAWGIRLQGARPHARMGRTRFFEFAP